MKSNTMIKTVKLFICIIVIIMPFYVIRIDAASTTHHIDGVPMCYQRDKPWCGAASIVMILQYWDVNITVEEAGESIDPEENGCYPRQIVRYVELFEFGIYELNSTGELKEWILKDHPVIVVQWMDESKESGHFRVVTGYDESFIYVNDPNGIREKFTYEMFLLLWSRHDQWGLTISPIKTFISDPYTNRNISIGG